MAFTGGTAGDFTTVRSPFNLQTQQKRLRHLSSISVRNLHSGCPGREHISRLESYFTLHTDAKLPAFYQSEKIKGSTNPSWQSFNINQYEDQINLASKSVVVRVWLGHVNNFRLLIEMEVHFSGLHFLTDKVQQVLVKGSPNTVILGLLDKEFVHLNKQLPAVKHLATKIADFDLPCSLLPAVVKVDKGSVRNSYTTSSLSRILTVLRAITQMKTHARSYQRQIEDKLLASLEKSHRLEEREHRHMGVSQLRGELLRRTTLLHHTQHRLQAIRDAAAKRGETLKSDTEEGKEQWKVLEEDKRDHITQREHLVKENALLSLRRRQMLSDLFTYVYPITVEKERYFINGVRLPHAEELQGQDEVMVAVALGCSCHLSIKVSQVLGVPLRHPMENRGSRSVIWDQVHAKLADKDREFPLYSKGKDKYHFNYGVFLLNKNISQLRYQCSLSTLDLRMTLQNLLTLQHKLGIRTEGAEAGSHPLTSTPDGTALSRASLNGSSQDASHPPFSASPSTDPGRGQGSRPGQQRSKTSDFSEDGSTGTSVADPRTKDAADRVAVEFDEAEEIFKPPPEEEDPFFKVGNPLMDEFNSLGAGSGALEALDVSQSDSRLSAIIQTASQGETLAPQSFQLLKQKRRGVRISPQLSPDACHRSDDPNSAALNGYGDEETKVLPADSPPRTVSEEESVDGELLAGTEEMGEEIVHHKATAGTERLVEVSVHSEPTDRRGEDSIHSSGPCGDALDDGAHTVELISCQDESRTKSGCQESGS